MIVTLQGGLGNQMFQYAFGRSVSLAKDEELFFTRYCVDQDPKRSYSLDAFNCDVKIVPQEREPRFGEPIFQYDSSVYTRPKGASFTGHWQSERYFNKVVVSEELGTFRTPISVATARVAEHIAAAAPFTAFLHIRRTDYMTAQNLAYHGVPSMNYYNEAI